MTKKSERWPRHKMGKQCGYKLHEDGSIEVAPSHSEALRAIVEEEAAIDAMLAAVTKQCTELLKPLVQRRARFWENLKDDYGLTNIDAWQLNYQTRMLTKRPVSREDRNG